MKSSRKRTGSRGLSVYTNLNSRRRNTKDLRSRRKAEYLATLPKHPIQRFFYRAHPKRFFAYWFSREGGIMALKISGVGILLLFLLFGALFAFYRRELDAIRPGELTNRVQTTVTRYYDRNDILLWEDKGSGDYKLVVDSADIAKSMKDATIAIEDKDFYKHAGFSLTGIARASINNFKGGDTQGGSTLTQQLVKQVFFADESSDRSLGGVPRKIKETILAIEVERMYNKDQILSLYLNESPYGGRRNGVESAAQTYFAKSAKDLTIAESALLASIPQQPGRYDPYNALVDEDAKAGLIARQHVTLANMVEQRMITQAQADGAKAVPIFDSIKPASDQFKDIKAPHFVQMVKGQLEAELGKATVGNGGLTVKTTLDWRAQQIVDTAMDALFASNLPKSAGFDNGAATVVDVPTGQVLALRGSRDYNYPGYGSVNAATAFIQPGSSIKPLVYSSLFKQRTGVNYGAGSVLADENIDSIVGYDLNNFDNKFRGSISIRSSLAESRNIPAVKAYYIDGKDNVLKTIHAMGDKSYCTDGVDSQVGAAMSIGGCGLKQVEHVNAFATIARMGVYKPVASVLEVKNAEGQAIKKWKDEGTQALDAQIPFIISDILSDDTARSPSYGRNASGLVVPGAKTGTKTGTSNLGNKSKDLWMMSYSPRIAMGIWVGNHVPIAMNNALSSIVGPTVVKIMKPLHETIYAVDGSWKVGDWFTQPAGVQKVSVSGRLDLFPSWYNKSQVAQGNTVVFDKVSKKKATDCTPDLARISLVIQKITDPVTKKTTFTTPDGYDSTAEDDLHSCDDVKPSITDIQSKKGKIVASVGVSTHAIQTVEFKVGETVIGNGILTSPGTYEIAYTAAEAKEQKVTVTVTDIALYNGTSSRTLDLKP
ncbi:penicillin-binding protein [Pedobacter sp.]|nr:penicillin-binding protein [Candidatus Saccharibacteria bacterium]